MYASMIANKPEERQEIVKVMHTQRTWSLDAVVAHRTQRLRSRHRHARGEARPAWPACCE
jgi:hypothetical protein